MEREAEASLEHIDAVISKYQTQVGRFKQQVQASISVQRGLLNQLNANRANMEHQFDLFQANAAIWAAKQVIKVCFDLKRFEEIIFIVVILGNVWFYYCHHRNPNC